MGRLIFVAMSVLFAGFAWLLLQANPTGDFVLRNLLPALIGWLLLAYVIARRGDDPRFWLGWAGFCIPALGLSGYLHLAFLFDWQELATRAVTPSLLFRFLPIYVIFAGCIGFAIGWIVGRGVRTGRV